MKKPAILCVKIGLAELEEDVLPLAHLTYAAQRTRSVPLSRFRLKGNLHSIIILGIFFSGSCYEIRICIRIGFLTLNIIYE